MFIELRQDKKNYCHDINVMLSKEAGEILEFYGTSGSVELFA